MQKIKILLLDERTETRLFELLAESLASKDFGLANDACAIRNRIQQLPVVVVPANFKPQDLITQVPVDPVRTGKGLGAMLPDVEFLKGKRTPPETENELGGAEFEVNVTQGPAPDRAENRKEQHT